MSKFRYESSEQRKARFEQFEQRLVMSAQAITHLLSELEVSAPPLTHQVVAQLNQGQESPTAAAARVAAEYGFDGRGQTVAVIDSGIAWDHHALGGGFGAGQRVVGGWDFADNDANPYDSGPAGHHGTHVAGIIAADHDRFRGVSSGVDLVALRVFNDQGQGNLEWVKQALQWVSQNQNNFHHPITTVVMSLGTQWNGFTKPAWANLESEFARLQQQGIFVSVAAGNSFQQYNAPGLSYPAVSENVVAVGSHNAAGQISHFSQRADRALFAPGESIPSTVPNHLFGGMAQNRFMSLTGTSMAAPYIAGASAILRQANDFMGVSRIDQDLIYRQLKETADRIFDPITNGHYYRVNLERALARVIPDLNDNTPQTATAMGVLRGGEQLIGTIGRLNDIDYFSFTAALTGRVEFQINATHQLDPIIRVLGTEVRVQGDRVSFDVQAGEKYTFSISTRVGNGHYTIQTDLKTGPAAVSWGQVSFLQTRQQISGESTFQLQASRNGMLTVQAKFEPGRQLTLEIYDSQMRLRGTQAGNQGNLRVDTQARQGETFFVKARGAGGEVDFRIGNQVAWGNGLLVVHGSQQNDLISIDARQSLNVSVNGIDYLLNKAEIKNVRLWGNGGIDRLNLRLGAENDNVASSPDRLFVHNSQFRLSAVNFSHFNLHAGGGQNTIRMEGSGSGNQFTANSQWATLQGSGFSARAAGFQILHAVSTGNGSRAELIGTEGDDVVRSRMGRTSLFTANGVVIADQFSATRIDARGGNDRAIFFESRGDREIELQGNYIAVRNENYVTWGSGFSNIHVVANRGETPIIFRDTTSRDIFRVDGNVASMVSQWYGNFAYGFKNIQAHSIRGGNDLAHIIDTQGNDRFTSNGDQAVMESADRRVMTRGFAQVNAVSQNGGFNVATLSGTQGSDRFHSDLHSSTLQNAGNQVRRVIGFQRTDVNLRDGINQVDLRGAATGHNHLSINQQQVTLQSGGTQVRISGASETNYRGSGGINQVVMQNLDLLEGLGNRAIAFLENHRVTAIDFHSLEASSVDQAIAEYDLDIVDFQYLLRGGWRAR
jgi:hypothetical protein